MGEKEIDAIQEDSLKEVTGGHNTPGANRKNCWFGNWSADPDVRIVGGVRRIKCQAVICAPACHCHGTYDCEDNGWHRVDDSNNLESLYISNHTNKSANKKTGYNDPNA